MRYYYFVEGECEKILIDEFKHGSNQIFKTGKVRVLNMVNKIISKPEVTCLEKNAIVFFVYDVDVGNLTILQKNIETFKKYSMVSKIYHIHSISNFEDEIIYSSNANKPEDIFKGANSVDEFKSLFVACKNLNIKLNSINFKPELIWSRTTSNTIFQPYTNAKAISAIKK